LELLFGAELGYRRGGLDPNASAVFSQASHLLEPIQQDENGWWPTIAVEAGVYLLSFRTSETSGGCVRGVGTFGSSVAVLRLPT
jgi:hypothetical protein